MVTFYHAYWSIDVAHVNSARSQYFLKIRSPVKGTFYNLTLYLSAFFPPLTSNERIHGQLTLMQRCNSSAIVRLGGSQCMTQRAVLKIHRCPLHHSVPNRPSAAPRSLVLGEASLYAQHLVFRAVGCGSGLAWCKVIVVTIWGLFREVLLLDFFYYIF